ncbi:alpha/beta-hydrolase [Clavulina sp. PMI_390]|nr:alpha/beta-hydrolase [Clavulina sp. PMI_390]
MTTPLGAAESPAAEKIQDIPILKPSREIPTSFGSSFSSWWASNSKSSTLSEERLFSRTPFFVPTNFTPSSGTDAPSEHGVRASLSFVHLNSPKRYMNTLSILPTGTNVAASSSRQERPPEYPPTVILPGYGAGIGFFYLNIASLGRWAARRNSPVYAVDWLGMGRSARVPFHVKAKREDIPARVDEAERFFTDALEEWREKQGIEKMALIGHSLGGYLSTAYALKYPHRVSRLILLSPAGVPRDPNEIIVPAEELTAGTSPEGAGLTQSDPDARVAHKPTAQEIKEAKAALKVARKNESMTRRFATWAWEDGWSIFGIVRSTVFWGPMIVGRYSSRRFSHLPEEDIRDLHDYIWNITSAKGSGEYSISHLLRPGAFARMPLVERVQALKVPVAFVYGDHDWMDADGGREAVERMRAAGNPDGRLYVIKHAGHHLYLDNPDAVNDLILRELKRPPTTSTSSAPASPS